MISRDIIEFKMRSPLFRLSSYLLIAIIIWGAANAGQIFGTSYGAVNISLIWPASGIALASILLFGSGSWIAIFSGLFINAFFKDYGQEIGDFDKWIISAAIATGVTLQALVGGTIIRAFSTRSYLNTVWDVVVFLVPAGILASTISCSIAIQTLYSYGFFGSDLLFSNWLTFYIGDVFGIFIFTPLIIVWLTHPGAGQYRVSIGEAFLMTLSFLLLTFLMTEMEWPLGQFYIPMAMWTTYRYRMHGASLINFLLAITALIPMLFGFGAWMFYLTENQLPIVIVYLATIISTSLILAGVLNERQAAWRVLQEHNISLSEAVHTQKNTLQALSREMIVKNKLAAFGLLTLNISRDILLPIKNIFTFTKQCQKTVDKLEVQENPTLKFQIDQLKDSLEEMIRFEKQAMQVVHTIESHSARTSHLLNEVKTINLHTLLSECIAEGVRVTDMPRIIVEKELSHSRSMVAGLPGDLSNAFDELLSHSIASMRTKSERKKLDYQPILTVRIHDHDGVSEITIEDNGQGLKQTELSSFFKSFMDGNHPDDPDETNLALAYDILVHVHHGHLEVQSVEGEYLRFKITLPLAKEEAPLR